MTDNRRPLEAPPKPKRPSVLAAALAAVGVTSSDTPEQPDVAAVEQPHQWGATRAEREAELDSLRGALQRATVARYSELDAKAEALRLERIETQRTFIDALSRLGGEVSALNDADYRRAFDAALLELEGLAREHVAEPNRRTAQKIAAACRAHGAILEVTLPNIGEVQHAAGVLARAMQSALGATTGGGKGGFTVATAAFLDEDVVVICDRLAELEREIRGAQRAARDRADEVRLRVAPHAI